MSDRPEDLLECLLVRVELDAAVNDQFEVWPDLADGAFAGELEDALEEHEQPARHTADQRDPFPDAPLGKQGQLRVPVRFEGQLERRKSVRAKQRRELEGGDPAQVALVDAGCGLLELGRAAQEEEPAVKETGIGPGGHVVGHHRLGSLAVRSHHLGRDGDVLGRSLGRAAGQGQKGDSAGPGQVLEDRVAGAEVIIPESLVGAQRNGRLEVGDAARLDRNRDRGRTGLPSPCAPTAASPAPGLVGGRESRPSMCEAGHEGETRRSPTDAPAESLQASSQRRCGSWVGSMGWAVRVRSILWTSSRIRRSVSRAGRSRRRPGAGCGARRRTGRPRNTCDRTSSRPRATR